MRPPASTEAVAARPERRDLRPLLIWVIGIIAYIAAVFHRSSLGVASLEAARRFGVGPSALAVLSMVQLAIYAAMQPPAGMLLDRYGSRRLLTIGATLMALGQLVFMSADVLSMGVAGRLLVGFGDALTFISVLRLVNRWFPPHRNPLFVQLTGALGQIGAIISAVPLIAVLQTFGWTAAFGGAAGLGLVVAILVVSVVRDGSERHADGPHAPKSWPHAFAELRLAWHEPGTRLGLWAHFVTQFPATVFGLMWGYPFLVSGQGFSPRGAGLMLTALTLGCVAFGPTIGHFVGRRPVQRVAIVLGTVALTMVAWTVVLLWPGPSPVWLLVLLVATMSISGPASMIGFDLARTSNPSSRLGSAIGVVNVGGFVASLATIVLVGVVLDVSGTHDAADASLRSFRFAMSTQFICWAIGIAQVVRYARKTRAA